jgi:hypothetical protein
MKQTKGAWARQANIDIEEGRMNMEAYVDRKMLIILIIILISCCAIVLSAQDWDRYKETTLKNILSTESYQLEPDYNVESAPHEFKVKVDYLGKHREPSPDKMKLVDM